MRNLALFVAGYVALGAVVAPGRFHESAVILVAGIAGCYLFSRWYATRLVKDLERRFGKDAVRKWRGK